MPETNQTVQPDYRSKYYFFNTIKIACIFFVFFFHATRIFDNDNWHIKNSVRAATGSYFFLNVGMAVMPLFFLVSGATVWISLQKRSLTVFVMNLFKRFFFPLVFGFTILAWPQVYLERVSHGEYSGSLLSFFPEYFKGLYGLGGNFAWMGLHLWYLGMLFIFSILLLPYFFAGMKLFKKPFFQKLAVNPLIWGLIILMTIYPGWKLFQGGLLGVRIWGGWNFGEHLIFFVTGFFIFSNDSFIDRIAKEKWLFLIIAILLTIVVIYWKADDFQPKFRSNYFTLQVCVRGVACWCWICAMLGITYHYFNKPRPVLQYLGKAILPFYILNQPLMILIAYYVVHWQINDVLKFFIILIGSLALTMLLYGIIRSFEATRWLFGIPPKNSVQKLARIVRRSKKANAVLPGQA